MQQENMTPRWPFPDLELIAAINTARKAGEENRGLEDRANRLYQADCKFAVYGTLGPGKPNHSHITDITGVWTDDHVTGQLVQSGWGTALGYPALVWSNHGDAVPKQLLTSTLLPQNWARLDAFGGKEYTRILVPLKTGGVANIYASTR